MSKILRFSVSQGKTHKGCKRKGYLEKVVKLPLKFADSTTRGSILHEVNERYLEADVQGLDEKGNPVDLYPEGWTTKTDYVRDDDGNDTDEIKQTKTITDLEAAWIKRIVADAISEGILWRPPNRVVEYGFEEMLLPATEGYPQVDIVGFIDLAFDWTIGDHKSCRNLTWTLNSDPKSSKYIGDDLQLLTYCYYWAMKRQREGFPLPDEMIVEHYQYPYEDQNRTYNKGVPQTTRTVVTWERILENYEELKELADDVRRTRTDADSYKDMEKNEESCGAYGGCPFRHICSGQESTEMYTERMNYAINPEKYLKEKTNKKETKVSALFDDILGNVEDNDAANTAGAVSDTKNETAKEEVTPKTEEPKGTETSGPANPPSHTKKVKQLSECTLEELDTKMTACVAAQDAGMDMSGPIAELQAAIDAIHAKEAAEVAKKEKEAKAKAKKEADAKAKKEAEEEAAKVQAAAEAEAEATTSTDAEQVEAKDSEVLGPDEGGNVPEKSPDVHGGNEAQGVESSVDSSRGEYTPNIKSTSERAPAGVILCINATMFGNYAKQISLQKVFEEYAKKHAGAKDVEAAVCADVEEIVAALKGYVILSSSITPNARALAAALKEHPKVMTSIGLLS